MKTLESHQLKSLRNKFIGPRIPDENEQVDTDNSRPVFTNPPWSVRPSLYLSTVLIFIACLIMSGGSFALFCIEFATLALIGFFLHAFAERYVLQEKNTIFSGAGNSLIITLGIVIPTVSFLLFAGFALPSLMDGDTLGAIETAVLLALMPLSNFIVAKSAKKLAQNRTRLFGLVNGVGLAISTTGSLICCSLLMGNSLFGMGYILAPYLWAAPFSLIAAALLSFDLWGKVDKNNRRIISTFTLTGIALSFVFIFAPNLRTFAVESLAKTAEQGSLEEQATAISILRTFASESDLKRDLQNTNVRLGPLLFPCYGSTVSENIYFMITGKPYSSNGNDFNHPSLAKDSAGTIIGNKIVGLTLAKSRLTGAVDERSLSASLDWTFIFKNNSVQDQEARARIALPPGAVISRLTLWINGKAHEAAFSSNSKTTEAYDWIVSRHRDPVLVTMCGPDTALVQCSPVLARGGEMKLRIGLKSSLEEQANDRLTLALPGILDTNFGRPNKHFVHIKSSSSAETDDSSSVFEKYNGMFAYDYSIADKPDSRSIGSINVQRRSTDELLATPDWYAHGQQYIVERIRQHASFVPSKLCVVVDQSSALSSKIADIKDSLSNIPPHTKTLVFFANDDPQQNPYTPLTMNEAKKRFETAVFAGGQDNCLALREALENASESLNGAVLWIHGPQPIKYIESELNELELPHAPALYDFEVGSGPNRLLQSFLAEYLQNISSYKKVCCQSNISEDLNKLFSEWKSGGNRLEVVRWATADKPKAVIDYNRTVSAQLTCIWAKEEVERLLSRGLQQKAETLASTYRLVTPVTGAVVLERESDYTTKQLDHGAYVDAPDRHRAQLPSDSFGSADSQITGTQTTNDNFSTAPPKLQGATSGTIGPQMDQPIITGVNTAGTVRINRLANITPFDFLASARDANLFDGDGKDHTALEAMVNILCFVCLCVCLPCGFSMAVFSVREVIRRGKNAKKLALLGATLLATGLFGPPTIIYVGAACHLFCPF